MRCNARPDRTTVVGRRLEAEGAFAVNPSCRLGAGHDGNHVFQSAMSDHPFDQVIADVKELVGRRSRTVAFQKFTCQHCGARQTMANPNAFHTTGRCEECGLVTDIVANGCNYLLIKSNVKSAEEIIEALKEVRVD
jgi:hypothetical protein